MSKKSGQVTVIIKNADIKLGDIKPYAKNSRTHTPAQIKRIGKSIQEFGFTNPILIDPEMNLIAGHARLEAAKKLGLESVPARVIEGLTNDQKRMLVIADNQIAIGGSGWDEGVLAEELNALMAAGADMDLMGFEKDDLAKFLNAPPEGLTDEDDVPPPERTSTTQYGSVFQLGAHKLLCGDCTDQVLVEKFMVKGSVNLVVTDPPYNVAYEGKTKEALKIQNDKMSNDGFYDFLLKAHQCMFNFSAQGAPVYVFHADSEGLNFRKALINAGYKLAQCCIWIKQSMVMGRQDYHWQHEPVLYGWKEGAAHPWHTDRKQTTLWHFDRPSKNLEHPTMKPVELIEYPINNSSKTGDVVFDPFGGSGSTLIACEKTGRQCQMIELDPVYVDVIIKRWEDFTGQKAKLLEVLDAKAAA